MPPPEAADSYPPIYLQPGPETSPFGRSLTITNSPNETATDPQYLALLGPYGRNKHRMVASEHRRSFDPNASFLFDDWRLVELYGRSVLRYGENVGDAGHWVMTNRGGSWNLWWFEPTVANMADLGEYVLVDVEVEIAAPVGRPVPAGAEGGVVDEMAGGMEAAESVVGVETVEGDQETVAAEGGVDEDAEGVEAE